MRHFKYILQILVFITFNSVHAGAYEDFFLAAGNNDAPALERLLRRGFDANTPGPQGQSALLTAIRQNAHQAALVLSQGKGPMSLSRRIHSLKSLRLFWTNVAVLIIMVSSLLRHLPFGTWGRPLPEDISPRHLRKFMASIASSRVFSARTPGFRLRTLSWKT